MRAATRHKRLKLRLAILLALAVISSLLALALRSTDALEPLELDIVDARFSLRGDHPPREDVVIVAVDDRSLRELGPSGAIPRRYHARVLNRLRSDRPRLIAYDVSFAEGKDAGGDRALLKAISRARNIVLAADPTGRREARVAGMRTPRELGARVGDTRGFNDRDGVYRQMPHFREPPQAFAVVAAELARGRAVDPARFPEGAAWIDFSGPPGSIPQHSFSRVVRGRLPRGAFRDKVVLVGATAPLLKDVVPTPVSADPMPGVEIHANSVATILDDFPLEELDQTKGSLLTVLLGLVAPLVALRLSAAFTVAAGLLAAAAYLVASQLAFNGGLILPITYPVVALFFGTASAGAVDLLLETRERRRLRHAFERFVPKDVVKAVLARADSDLRLGGELLDATVLFCDLREFSRFCERHSAATVIRTLNRYLTEVSEAVFSHGGTVVSYMGDGVMAVFGAPIEQEDNAERAYAAAHEILEQRLPVFNAWIREHGLGDGFRVGIGLCTGPVMSGNVGSNRRVEYTAVGDTTNLAARLQARNKRYGSQLLMAESTRVRLSVPDDELAYVGDEEIPGRSGTLKMWRSNRPAEVDQQQEAPAPLP